MSARMEPPVSVSEAKTRFLACLVSAGDAERKAKLASSEDMRDAWLAQARTWTVLADFWRGFADIKRGDA